jgi:ribosomal protein S27AE
MGISDLMWQCILLRGDELGDNITAHSSKMIENIGHWISRYKYGHFWLDVAVHLGERWWIGRCYYSAHFKMIGNIGHWIWRYKYVHFWLDVVVHFAERWWIGRCYYSAHFKNDRQYRALNLKIRIWAFLTWCGSAFGWEVGNCVTILQRPLQKW